MHAISACLHACFDVRHDSGLSVSSFNTTCAYLLSPFDNLNNFFVSVFSELKDNLGSDEPEGDAPLLLQTMLARNPGIFREKSMEMRAFCLSMHESMLIIIEHSIRKTSFMLMLINKYTIFSFLYRCYAAANGTTVQNYPKFHA